jgi:hypothetical protein
MELLDHAKMDKGQLSTAQSYAKLLPAIGAELNQLLKKHGLSDMHIDSFVMKKRAGVSATAKEPYPTGIGVTADGSWVAKSY